MRTTKQKYSTDDFIWDITKYIDTDVLVDNRNMTYEWVHNVDTFNWI